MASPTRHRMLLGLAGAGALALAAPVTAASAATTLSITTLTAPAASGSFGASVAMLDSGNVVVTDPLASTDSLTHNGAVYLYDGKTHALISTLKGSHNEDQVGSGGVTALANGSFAVASPLWDDGSSSDVGAVTWGSGTTGVAGTVSAANSVVGSLPGDSVGNVPPVALPSGAYVIQSSLWDNGVGLPDAGAITWASGVGTTVGAVSPANSLIGGWDNNKVGSGTVTVLTNGNYVVTSPEWNDGVGTDLGAVSWGPGTAAKTGTVSASNSILGSTSGDGVGSGGVTALTNGNYVVSSPNWDNGGAANAGAVTWGNGAAGTNGTVDSTNSLVGSTTDDHVGLIVVALTNGNYVTASGLWDGSGSDNGAVTWGNGASGTAGAVAAGNSLVGGSNGDKVGSAGVIALTNGNYVFGSPDVDGDASNTGAATWASGVASSHATVSSGNSLVGKQADDAVGAEGNIVALKNGNYVVASPAWDNDVTANAGAVTWGSGTTGTNGYVATTNSLVGTRTNDSVGSGGVVALSNGNYVSGSPDWNDGTHALAGAATWASGASAFVGTITSANSLVGTHDNDRVGIRTIALTGGGFVVGSPDWNDGTNIGVGAATWGSGTAATAGAVSASNSLVGSQSGDHVSGGGLVPLAGGHYVVVSPNWTNGTTANAGAVTWGRGTTGISGAVSASNSLVGTHAGDTLAAAPPPRPTQLGSLGTTSVTRLAGNLVALPDGSYAFFSPLWNSGQGAFSWGRSDGSTTGAVSSSNSIVPFCSCVNTQGLGGFDSETLRAALGNRTTTVWFATYGTQLPPNGANTGILTLIGVGIAAAGAGLTWQVRRPRRTPIPVRVRRPRRG